METPWEIANNGPKNSAMWQTAAGDIRQDIYNGSPKQRKEAQAELLRMARLADAGVSAIAALRQLRLELATQHNAIDSTLKEMGL